MTSLHFQYLTFLYFLLFPLFHIFSFLFALHFFFTSLFLFLLFFVLLFFVSTVFCLFVFFYFVLLSLFRFDNYLFCFFSFSSISVNPFSIDFSLSFSLYLYASFLSITLFNKPIFFLLLVYIKEAIQIKMTLLLGNNSFQINLYRDQEEFIRKSRRHFPCNLYTMFNFYVTTILLVIFL